MIWVFVVVVRYLQIIQVGFLKFQQARLENVKKGHEFSRQSLQFVALSIVKWGSYTADPAYFYRALKYQWGTSRLMGQAHNTVRRTKRSRTLRPWWKLERCWIVEMRWAIKCNSKCAGLLSQGSNPVKRLMYSNTRAEVLCCASSAAATCALQLLLLELQPLCDRALYTVLHFLHRIFKGRIRIFLCLWMCCTRLDSILLNHLHFG